MLWCLIGLSACVVLLGLAMVSVRAPRVRSPGARLGLLLRGCVATLCLFAAVVLVGLALWARGIGL